MDLLMNLLNKLDVNFVALLLVTIIGVLLILVGHGIQRGDLVIKKSKIIFGVGLSICIIGIGATVYKTIKPAKDVSKEKYIRIWGWDYEVGKPVVHVDNTALKEGIFYFTIVHPHDGMEWKARKDYSFCSVFNKMPNLESHEIFFDITNPKAYPYQERIVFRLFEWNKDKYSLMELLTNSIPLQTILDQGATLVSRVRATNDYDIRNESGRNLFLQTIDSTELQKIRESICNQ